MNIKKNYGMAITDFHRCDAPLADEPAPESGQKYTQATGTCQPSTYDPNQWNLWADRIGAGPLHLTKPD